MIGDNKPHKLGDLSTLLEVYAALDKTERAELVAQLPDILDHYAKAGHLKRAFIRIACQQDGGIVWKSNTSGAVNMGVKLA